MIKETEYICEVCGKKFKTEEEAAACEEQHKKKEKELGDKKRNERRDCKND